MQTQSSRVITGVKGLDTILSGGLPQGRLYLLEGPPGSGKTTLSLQFLLQGLKQGERCLYVTLSETAEELREVAAAHVRAAHASRRWRSGRWPRTPHR